MPGTGRRLVTLLVVLAIVGAPAVALHAFCIGASCEADDATRTAIPFCSLPTPTRALIAAGFREGRSPDVIGVSGSTPRVTSDDATATTWPWAGATPADLEVPLAFAGTAIVGGELPSAGLADVAPTLEPLLGLQRDHPEVRAGRTLEGVTRPGVVSPLIVEIVWKGVGRDEDHASALRDVVGEEHLAYGTAAIGSLPLDPAAVLTTIGSGGLPAEHGITGSLVRTGEGGVTAAWSTGAPLSVIATLADDLDEATGGRAMIGLVADATTDRGLIGGTWYPGQDDDDVIFERREPLGAVSHLLDLGYGSDDVPDIVGVTLTRRTATDETTRSLAELVLDRTPNATLVVTATGAAPASDGTPGIPGRHFAARVDRAASRPLVAAVGTSGLFLDQGAVTTLEVPTQRVVDVMLARTTPDGTPILADAFPAFAVQFGRYC